MGRRFWAVFLAVFFPGLMFAFLFFFEFLGMNWVLAAGVEVLLILIMGLVLVGRFGVDALSESREEILDELDAEEPPGPGGLPNGESLSARDIVAAFDRTDGNRPDPPG